MVGAPGGDRAAAAEVLAAAGFPVAETTEADLLAAREWDLPALVVLADGRGRAERDATQARLAAHPALQGVPLVVLGLDADIDSYATAITRGAAAYLPRPFDHAQLADAARRLSGWRSRGESTEKRRRLRRPLLMEVDVDLRGDKRRIAGRLVDASATGCRVEVAEEVAKGQAVRVTLHGHRDSVQVPLGAEVRWHVAADEGAHELGLRFTGPSADIARQMLGFEAG